MPVYACYRGDCANLAIEEPNGIVLQDALGKSWFCVETGLSEIPPDPGTPMAELLQAQRLAHKHGLSVAGSALRLLVASDAQALARKLVLETYPSVAESADRLRNAGWLELREERGTEHPFRVLVSNGKQTVQAEGKDPSEAWYRVAQEALREKPSMTLPIQADPVPLRADQGGALRVGNSRVSLDTLINEYENGADPEGIVNAYRTLQLADVYAVLAYYLRHRDEVKDYLRRRQAAAGELRREIESQQPGRDELHAKLLARKAQLEQGHASVGS